MSSALKRALLAACFCFFLAPHATFAATLTSNLTLGSSGTEVTSLQSILRYDGYFTYPTNTGYFGAATRTAVEKYQTAHGIPSTGYVGLLTRVALNNDEIAIPTTTSTSGLTIAQMKVLLLQLEEELAALLGTSTTVASGGGGGGGSSSGNSGGGGGSTPTPPAISAIASSTAQTTATVTWTTDQTSTSQLVYGTTTAYGLASSSASSVTSHSLSVTGLATSTLYHFAVVSVGSGGTSTSSDQTFTTLAAAPVISAIASSTATTTATVSWTTDLSSNSEVVYGTTTGYGSATSSAPFVTSHSLGLTGLASSTLYHFAVVSATSGGLISTSSDHTLTTTLVAPFISSITSSTTVTTAGVGWTTDVLSNSKVVYGLTTSYGSMATSSALIFAHYFNLTGLATSTQYHFEVVSATSGGLTSTSSDQTFTTATSSCPQGNSYSDGCSGAPSGTGTTTASTLYENSNFFNYARQSGQSYTTRPPWNVAGVDYPVGIPSGTTLKVPGVDALPSGCTFNSGTGKITCTGSSNPTFNGWDLSNTWINFGSSTGTCTVENSKLVNGALIIANSFQWIDVLSSSSCNFVFENNYVDTKGTGVTNWNNLPLYPIEIDDGGSLTMEYNAFFNTNSKVYVAGVGNITDKYNYIEGINYDSNQHGEMDLLNGTVGTLASYDQSFDTFLLPSTFGSGMTATTYLSAGSANGSTITNAQVDHNTMISNLFAFTASQSGTTLTVSNASTCQGLTEGGSVIPPGGTEELVTSGSCSGSTGSYSGTMTMNTSENIGSETMYQVSNSVAGVEMAYNNITGTLTLNSNYIDPTGAFLCFANEGVTIGSTVQTGNIDLVDGSSIGDFTGGMCHDHN